MGSGLRAVPGQRTFLVMSLTWALGRQHTSLRGGSIQHIGPSVHLRRQLPTAATCLFLMEVVVTQGVGLSDSCNTSGADGPPSSSSIDQPSTSSYLLYRRTWEGEVGKKGIYLLPRARTCCPPPLFFELLPSTCPKGKIQDPLDIVFFFWWLFLSQGGPSHGSIFVNM